jgi:hypothetical protein
MPKTLSGCAVSTNRLAQPFEIQQIGSYSGMTFLALIKSQCLSGDHKMAGIDAEPKFVL